MSFLRRLFDARLASLAVIVLGFAAAIFLAVDAYGWWQAEKTALSDLDRRTALLEQRALALARRDQDDGKTATDGRVLVYGDTPGLAVAELQRILTVSTEKSGALLRSMDTPQGETIADSHDAQGNLLQRVRLSAEIEVMEQALPDLLYAIETDMPVMIVDALTLRGRRTASNDATTGWAADDRPLVLRVDISAFRSGAAP